LPLKYLINVTGESFQALGYLESLNYSAWYLGHKAVQYIFHVHWTLSCMMKNGMLFTTHVSSWRETQCKVNDWSHRLLRTCSTYMNTNKPPCLSQKALMCLYEYQGRGNFPTLLVVVLETKLDVHVTVHRWHSER
jgi:hypothetical protein